MDGSKRKKVWTVPRMDITDCYKVLKLESNTECDNVVVLNDDIKWCLFECIIDLKFHGEIAFK